MIRAALLAILALSSHAQSFDVASLKPSPSTGGLLNINHGSLNHGLVTLTNVTLSECVEFAYGLISDDQVDGPAWTRDRSVRFDIAAKTAPDATLDTVRPMMRQLLAVRFHLAAHQEQKVIPHLELSASRKGPKMPLSKPGAARGPSTYKLGRLVYDQMPMHTLAVQLSRLLKQPVLDLTGLPGLYDVHLEWAADDAPPAGVPLPDIFQAVEEELGLHLESRKTPLDVIVIDRANQVPIAN